MHDSLYFVHKLFSFSSRTHAGSRDEGMNAGFQKILGFKDTSDILFLYQDHKVNSEDTDI